MRTRMMLCPSVPPSCPTVPTRQGGHKLKVEGHFKKKRCASLLLKPFRRLCWQLVRVYAGYKFTHIAFFPCNCMVVGHRQLLDLKHSMYSLDDKHSASKGRTSWAMSSLESRTPRDRDSSMSVLLFGHIARNAVQLNFSLGCRATRATVSVPRLIGRDRENVRPLAGYIRLSIIRASPLCIALQRAMWRQRGVSFVRWRKRKRGTIRLVIEQF